MRRWLRDPDLHNSARTALAAVAALLLARLFGMPEWYWAVITTVVVMQSVIGTSLPIAGRQLAGNALGAGIGILLAVVPGPRAAALGAGIFILGLICTLLGRIHSNLRAHLDRTTYRYSCVTLAIILLIPRPQALWIIALHRFLEVSIGIIVALAMTLLWPQPAD